MHRLGIKALLILGFQIIIESLFASVNPLNGELNIEQTDIKINTEEIYSFDLKREYNQKKIGFGLMGRAWCGNLEEKIVKYDDKLIIEKCGFPTTAIFYKKDKLYINNNETEFVEIISDNEGYIRISNNFIRAYNSLGHLMAISTKENYKDPFLLISYDKNKNNIETIVLNSKLKLFFIYDSKINILKEINDGHSNKVIYSYDDKYNLISVNNSNKENYTFEYNEKEVLSKINLNKKKEYEFKYTPNLLIENLIDKNNCNLKFKYTMNSKNSSISTETLDSCTQKKEIYKSKSTSLFFNNKLTIKNSKLKNKSTTLDLFNNNEKNIGNEISFNYKEKKWTYLKEKNGHIIQIKLDTNKQSKIQILKIEYKNSKIFRLILNNKIGYNFNERKSNLNKTEIQSLLIFTQFLSDEKSNI